MRSAAIIAVLGACLWGAGSASATVPGQNGTLAWQRGLGTNGSGPPEIYTDAEWRLTVNAGPDENPGWSPDGKRIAWESAPDTTSPSAIWVMRFDAQNKFKVTAPPAGMEDRWPAWSPDGTRIAFVRTPLGATGCATLRTVAPDGTGLTTLASGPECRYESPAWSPDGTKLAYRAYDTAAGTEGLYVANADNSAPVKIASGGTGPSWSPSGRWIVYETGFAILRTTPDGQTVATVANGLSEPEYSPDGTRIALIHGRLLDDAGNQLLGFQDYRTAYAWQPVQPPPDPPGYARPKGATPYDVSLVPAFQQCFEPNRDHGAPFAVGSCAPPGVTSSLTIGTPDSNGQPAASTGRIRFAVLAGNPATSADEADVAVSAAITDVRCRAAVIAGCEAALGDYSAPLVVHIPLKITDERNGGSAAEAATTRDIPSYQTPLPVAVPCLPTAGPGPGSTCAVDTTIDALVPNAIEEGARATWELGRIEVYDSGPDGNPASYDNGSFEAPGLFVP
jgi:hypothetical protein